MEAHRNWKRKLEADLWVNQSITTHFPTWFLYLCNYTVYTASVTGLEIACSLWPAASHVSLITGSKGAPFVWSSSLTDRECGNWLWLDVIGLIDTSSHHYSWLPRCCFKGWCHRFLIDPYVLPHMALPQLLVFILPCSLVGTASWVSCLNNIVVFSPFSSLQGLSDY